MKMMIELTKEQIEFVSTALILRMEEIRSIPKEERTERTIREYSVIDEFNDALHEMEFEYDVATSFDAVMSEVKELLSNPE